jgi:hypothetical protein
MDRVFLQSKANLEIILAMLFIVYDGSKRLERLMAKKNRKNKKVKADQSKQGNNAAIIALLLIVGVVAVMAWAFIGMKKPPVDGVNNVQLPAYAYASAKSEQAYRISLDPAIQDEDVLSKIPCYCGCVGVGHKSLKECFLDDHGSYCGICQEEAIDTYEMVKKGYSIAQIRDEIDAKYGGGRFAEGTDTPPV